jgi:hypothetical protein
LRERLLGSVPRDPNPAAHPQPPKKDNRKKTKNNRKFMRKRQKTQDKANDWIKFKNITKGAGQGARACTPHPCV